MRIILAIAIFLICAASPLRLYTYPFPPVIDGVVLPASPITVTAEQATTEMPDLPQIAGVAVVIPWSLLCPTEAGCDLTIIHRIANYWHSRGKSIVLGIETVGYPFRTDRSVGPPHNVTPDWVRSKVSTYYTTVKVLGGLTGGETARVDFPDYGDPLFLAQIASLLRSLQPLDGDPAIAELRIGAGLTTEDNPSPGGATWLIPGFTDADWLVYCRRLTALYASTFHHTRLEFDIGFTGLAAWRGSRKAADQFVNDLIGRRLFLAFDGLSDRTQSDIVHGAAPKDWLGEDISYLMRAHNAGLAVGLELRAPLALPDMQDIPALVAALQALPAERLVIFPFEAAAIDNNSKGDRRTKAALEHWVAVQPLGKTHRAHTSQLLELLLTHTSP